MKRNTFQRLSEFRSTRGLGSFNIISDQYPELTYDVLCRALAASPTSIETWRKIADALDKVTEL